MPPRRWIVLACLAAVAAAGWSYYPTISFAMTAYYWELKMGHGEGRLQVGDQAPDFELQFKKSPESVRLSSFRGDRPVALVFGSYT
jgi:hypothetical protein